MGSPGNTPILQDGGLQEAVSAAPPRVLRALALLVAELLVVVLKAATSGLVVLQVRGGLVRGELLVFRCRVSYTVAVIETLPPLFTVIEFPAWPWPPIWSEMDWMRQVV